jgi:alanine racemase
MFDQAIGLLKAIDYNSNLSLEGVYTHLHGYDPSTGVEYAKMQFGRFQDILSEADQAGIKVPVRMASGSAAVLQFPEMDLDAVDPGSMLFGIRATNDHVRPDELQHALTAIKSRILLTKDIRVDHVGEYPSPFPVKRTTRIGLIPFGWGDGMPRKMPRGAEVLIRERRAPMIGPVHLEHLRVDITSIPHAEAGDDIMILGQQGKEEIKLEVVAQQWNMDIQQFYGSLKDQLPRCYLQHTS